MSSVTCPTPDDVAPEAHGKARSLPATEPCRAFT